MNQLNCRSRVKTVDWHKRIAKGRKKFFSQRQEIVQMKETTLCLPSLPPLKMESKSWSRDALFEAVINFKW